MPDVLQTSDHYKHSRRWSLSGRWGRECVVCLVFLLDSSQTTASRKRSLLGEILYLLRSSDEFGAMLSDCNLVTKLAKTVVNSMSVVYDNNTIDCLVLLEDSIKCTKHQHSKAILDFVISTLYKSATNPRAAALLSRAILELANNNIKLKNEVINARVVEHLVDSLKLFPESIQEITLSFLDSFNSLSPLSSVLSEVKLLKLLNDTIKFLPISILTPKCVCLLGHILPSVKSKYLTNYHGNLISGLKHALAYTKSSEIIAKALNIIHDLNAPNLLVQYNMIDYILECLSSEDERVCLNALAVCTQVDSNSISRRNASSTLYISEVLLSLLEREKSRMRDEIVENALRFLLQLRTIRIPSDLTETLLAIMEWGSERVVILTCLTVMKYNVSRTSIHCMKMLISILQWQSQNLSLRLKKIAIHNIVIDMEVCKNEGEQVLAVILSTIHHLVFSITILLPHHRDILKDLVRICDEHCMRSVLSIDCSEVCPHVYKHLFRLTTLILCTLFSEYNHSLVAYPPFAIQFVEKIFGLLKDVFALRMVLCNSYKEPDVLHEIHVFTSVVICLHVSTFLTLDEKQSGEDQQFKETRDVKYREDFSRALLSASQPSFQIKSSSSHEAPFSSSQPNFPSLQQKQFSSSQPNFSSMLPKPLSLNQPQSLLSEQKPFSLSQPQLISSSSKLCQNKSQLSSSQRSATQPPVYSLATPNAELHAILMKGFDALPLLELPAALSEVVRKTERPSYHVTLSSHTGYCSHITCLLLIYTSLSSNKPQPSPPSTIYITAVNQIVNTYGTHHSAGGYFVPIVLKTLTLLLPPDKVGNNFCLMFDTQHQFGNITFASFDLEMLKFVVTIPGLNVTLTKRCTRLLLERLRSEVSIIPTFSESLTVALFEALVQDRELCQFLNVMEKLILNGVPKETLLSLVDVLHSSNLYDIDRYDIVVNILNVISTQYALPINNRCLSAVLQCVLNNSNSVAVSLQYLYIQFINNPSVMVEVFENRYDLISLLGSYIKPKCLFLEPSLLLLVEILRNQKRFYQEMHVDLNDVLEIIERCQRPVVLSALWVLIAGGLFDDNKRGLAFLALKHVLHPDCVLSFAAGHYLLKSGFLDTVWCMASIETCLYLETIPVGIIMMLNGVSPGMFITLVKDKLAKHFPNIRKNIKRYPVTVVKQLTIRLLECFSDSSKVKRFMNECKFEDSTDWTPKWMKSGSLLYHSSSFELYTKSEITDISNKLDKYKLL